MEVLHIELSQQTLSLFTFSSALFYLFVTQRVSYRT